MRKAGYSDEKNTYHFYGICIVDGSNGMQKQKPASDGAQMQTDDPNMPTRVIENGTPINMHFGKTVIPGVLNDSDTAKALIEKLPYTVHMSSYSHDFCGVIQEELPYKEDEVHFGWLNGDIDYAIDAPYFTILHSDEESSEQYGSQVNIMDDYSGFEKVGSLGKSLPTDNQQITTQAWDIVLYSGNQIVMFYGSNSWDYTKIGRIDDLSGWEDALGTDSVTAVFSIVK